MSRRGDCWDNSAVESFFASLKKERVHRKTYPTRDDARADIFDYIERSTIPGAGIRRSGRSAPWSSNGLCGLSVVSGEPGEFHFA